MKKVGLLTYHFSDNYGALMQCFGLVSALNTIGVHAVVINYHPDHVEGGGSFVWPFSQRALKANLVILYQKITNLYKTLFSDDVYLAKFETFREKYFQLSGSKLKKPFQLDSIKFDYDYFVCGSDQIWNPSAQYGIDPIYFLSFCAKELRISYAPSFGRASIPEIYHKEVGRYLSEIPKLSVREKSGVALIKKLASRDAKWVPDPTLLVKSYDDVVISPARRNPFLMAYVLRSGKGVAELQRKVADALQLEIVEPYNPMRRWKPLGEIIFPGPEEWLGYIKEAKFVVTNSFHGTVFSVLFNKPFLTVGLPGTKSELNERAASFLGRVGLLDRLISEEDVDSIDDLVSKPIDWDSVNQKVNEWRNEGLEFLKDSLLKD